MAGDEWYAIIRGTAVGPVTFDSLRRMAAKGKLLPSHKVKESSGGAWAEASSVPGIFALAPSRRKSPAWAAEPLKDEWYSQVADEVLGPMSQDELLRLAADGRLTDRDHVRYGATGEWVEAREHRWLWGGGPIKVVRKAARKRKGGDTASSPPPASGARHEAQSAAVPAATSDDPDLAAVVAAWNTLSEALRAEIVAMVKAAGARPKT